MKEPYNVPNGFKDFLRRYGFLIFSAGYLLLAFRLLPDFGLGFDSPKNFEEGRINLDYLLTGRTLPQDQILITYQVHGAFFFMVADLFKRILSDHLGWLAPLPARHAFLPILVFLFVNAYFAFLKKRTGAWTASLTCLLLLTVPPFFGHAFYNIKDIPLLVCFSISVLFFYEWRQSGFRKLFYLYGFFLAAGLTLLSKFYALLIPVILVLWLFVLKQVPGCEGSLGPSSAGGLRTRKNLYHASIGIALAAILVLFFFMPAIYSIEDKMIFLSIKAKIIKNLVRQTQGWSLFPWIQLACTLPILTQAAAFLGMVRSFLKRSPDALRMLMLVWFFTVILTACTPLFPVYNGIRLFMVFLVPFCFFAAEGAVFASELLGRLSPLRNNWGAGILGILLIAFQIGGIIETHPYESTFFNRLAGGLRGAQEKNIPDASDYWLTSYREAVQWINRKAPPNANLLVPGPDSRLLLRYYPTRKDIPVDMVQSAQIPGNSFLLVAPGEASWVNVPRDHQRAIMNAIPGMIKAHEIRRQNGTILTIYYKV